MQINKFLLLFLSILILTSCSKNIVEDSVLKEKSLDLQVLEAYQEGKNYLENGDPLFAAKKFNEAEILFPRLKNSPCFERLFLIID